MRQLIFVVENDAVTRTMVRHCLEQAGYALRTCSSGRAVEEAEHHVPALLLISWPFFDGGALELQQRIRRSLRLAQVPIVTLAAGASEEDRVRALESGADDCISKPFSPRELVARVQAVLRRAGRPVPQAVPEEADILIDSTSMQLSVHGNQVPATSLEFRFVDYLARHRGQVFTRDLLLDAVWGDAQFVTPRNVDACVRRIRDKIEPDRHAPTYLKTVRGVGYRFDAVASWHPAAERNCTCTACMTATGNSFSRHSKPGGRNSSHPRS